ncbi:hypothetical protein V7S43_011156 [Phytophthora oleae]|uniref:FYVE-type domain-containing protein n=1 Tax=Phytophthora oleae TaxID=2107226 RepID=A0ABD3FBD1_9STRA
MEETFSGARISIHEAKVSFPLPKGYFPDVNVSEEQTQEYRDLVRQRLEAILSDEKCCNERLANGLPSLNPRDWKSVRSFDGLQLFRRRHRGRATAELAAEEDFPQAIGAVANGQPSVVALGNIPGTIEDVLYGFAGTTDEETRTTLSFLLPTTDAAILRNLELATVDDPLHYFGLKWLYAARSIGAPRDLCCLQAMGVEVDSCDNKYGYLMLHSVDLTECPSFKTNVVRGKVFFTCIFRETTPGFVDVLARGIFDMSGGNLFPKFLAPCTTSAFIGGLRKLVDCANAKKLTVLARRTVSRVQIEEDFAQLPPPRKKAVCVVCMKRDGSGFFGVHLRSCRVCGMPICSKCQTKDKRVFLGCSRPWSPVPCCPMCALEAQRMTNFYPFGAEFAVVADYFTEKSAISYTSTNLTSFGLPLADQIAACAESKESPGGVLQCPNASKLSEQEVQSDDSFCESLSDLDASQICPSSTCSSNDEGVDKEGTEQLPAVVEELLRSDAKIDCQREQVEFTQRYLHLQSGEPPAPSRTTIADFRGEMTKVFLQRESETSSRHKELAATLLALQSTADQIYGDVVAHNQ